MTGPKEEAKSDFVAAAQKPVAKTELDILT